VAGAAPRACALVLHGILGSGRNWRGFARRLVAARPDLALVLVDLRNHGESWGSSRPVAPPHTLEACAEDLDALLPRLAEEGVDAPRIVIGHSFGGKVALTWARRRARAGQPLAQCWVLDALPGPMDLSDPAGAGEVARVIAGLRALPQPLARRDDLVRAMLAAGFSRPLAMWMTTNLRRGEGGLVWRFDLDGVERMLQDYARIDLRPWLRERRPGAAITFVRAARSDRWTPAALADLDGLPGAAVTTLPDAGHWLHVDNPTGLQALLADGLLQEASR
jgi:pimeloyl-ACP methyl ester carboxylesterase